MKKIFIKKIICFSFLLSINSQVVLANQLNFDIDTGIGFLSMPEHQFFANRGSTSPFERKKNLKTDDGDASGLYIGGRVGYDWSTSLLQSTTTGFELRGSLLNADNSTNAIFVDTVQDRFGWIILDNSSGFGAPSDHSLKTSLNRDYKYYTTDILAKVSYLIKNKHSISIYIGPSFRQLNEETRVLGKIQTNITNVTTTEVTLDENLDTSYAGCTIGLKFHGDINDKWLYSIDTTLSAYYAESDYDGYYTATNGTTNIKRNRSESDIAYGARLQVDIDRKLSDVLSIGVFVAGEYLSYVPKMNYGSVPTDPDKGLLRIEKDQLLSLSGGLSLTAIF